jgi:hypothetical protein
MMSGDSRATIPPTLRSSTRISDTRFDRSSSADNHVGR